VAQAPISREQADHTLAVIREVCEEGFPLYSRGGGGNIGALSVARGRLGINVSSLVRRLQRIKALYGLEPDPKWEKKEPVFMVPAAPVEDASQLIEHLAAEHRKKSLEHRAATPVHITTEGPIGIAFFGDPHVDDPGCAWGPLKDDVETCRDTEGMLAVQIGDGRNNWVGRLMALYAEQSTTASQGIALIEWLLTSLPWLLWVAGNHGRWGSEHGNAEEIIHRLQRVPGMFTDEASRLRLCLPGGAEVMLNIRHDFPGSSQFNPAHAMVRQTLFNYRDHIMACGHRHQSGYMPIWHNDPARLCHGFRVGTYKDFDKYADEKGFKHENWARSMVAIVDPEYAGDPVRFIRPCFSIAEGADYLRWRRGLWAAGRRPSDSRPKPLKRNQKN